MARPHALEAPELPTDTASVGWRRAIFGGGTFDVAGNHDNQRGWELFELGQRMFWDVPTLLDWEEPIHEDPEYAEPIAAMLGFLMPGEKIAVTGASLVSLGVRTEEAKFYFVEQALEEAKHFDVMRRIIPKITGRPLDPVKPSVRALYTFGVLDKNDVAFMMGNINIIGEHLANQIFFKIKRRARDPGVQKMLEFISKDESRHIAAGRRFFSEVYDSYREHRRVIMAKNLATVLLLGAAASDLVRPMDELEIDLGAILHTMYNHYEDVTCGLPAFPEQPLLDLALTLVRKSTVPGLKMIRSVTSASGEIDAMRLLAACEKAITSPRQLRALFA